MRWVVGLVVETGGLGRGGLVVCVVFGWDGGKRRERNT